MTRTFLAVLLSLWQVPAWAGMPDPTRPSFARGEVVRAQHGLRLESVLISPLRRQAVVSGRLVRVGSVVDGATVMRIERGGIWLRRPDGLMHLGLVRLRINDIRQYRRGGGS